MAVRQRNPGGRNLASLERPVRTILMPGRVLGGAGIPHESVIEEQSRFSAAHESADDFG